MRVVIINEKPWTRAREVCRALEYNKRTAHVIKDHVSPENYAQKYQMSSVPAAVTPVNWPKDSQKYDIYINEEGMYELSLSSQQPKVKDFRRHCCNALFPHVRQQLTNKMKGEHQQAITDHQQQILRLNEDHQQAIEEKDAVVSLLNDDQKNCDFENVALQAQRDVYNDQLKKCQGIITRFRTRYVDHAKDPGKDSIVMITQKNTAPEEDEFYEYPCYIARLQGRFINTKR